MSPSIRTLLAPLIVLALLAPSSPMAQAGWVDRGATGRLAIAWHRSIRNGLNTVTVAPDGAVYVAGRVRQHVRPWHTWAVLRRYTPSGAVSWTRRWHPPNAWAESVDVEALPDGSVVWAGAMNPDNMEGALWFLRRYDAFGRLLWRRTAPSWRDGGATRISDLAVGGGIIAVAGTDFGCCGDPHRDGWVRAYGPDGTFLWTNRFEFPGVAPALFDEAQSVAVGALGRVFVAGWANLETTRSDAERLPRTIVVQKLGPTGGNVWTWTMRAHAAWGRVDVAGLSARGDELMVAARLGEQVTPTYRSNGRSWLARLSFGGDLIWERTWGDDPGAAAEPTEIAIDRNGIVYLSGSARDAADERMKAFIRAYRPTGRLLWFSTASGGDESMVGTHIAASKNGLVITGTLLAGRWDDRERGGHVWVFEGSGP